MSDDNKVKLLKIQHALLEALAEKKIHAETDEIRSRLENELALCLLKYKELVTEIEHGIYLELRDKLEYLSTAELTLEEELNHLEGIETFYNQLVEIQTRFKQTYALYSQEPLILSDIARLNIESYFTRKEAIKAYLINKKNIADVKDSIAKINDELISEEQKETRIDKKIAFLDDEIIRRLLSSEGRLLENDNNQETLKYTSIATEYQTIGITLEKDRYTGTTIEELTAAANETKEKLTAATISYEVLPTIEKKKILDEIRQEHITANYQLVMGKLLIEFYSPSKNCLDALQKRERIKDLLKYRQTYLSNLGIKYGVDPFTRLHINEQIEELKQYENNSRTISRLRRELANLNARIETLEADNVENSTKLEESQNAIQNGQAIPESQPAEPSFNDFTESILPAEVRTLDNQVVSVNEPQPGFNYKKCQEITKNVIKKVYEILTHPEISMPKEQAPELVIEPQKVASSEPITSVAVPEPSDLDQVFESQSPAPTEDPLFSETSPFVDLPEVLPPTELTDEDKSEFPELAISQDFTPELVIADQAPTNEEPTPSEALVSDSEPSISEPVLDLPEILISETESVEPDDVFSSISHSEPSELTENHQVLDIIPTQDWAPELVIEPKITIQPASVIAEPVTPKVEPVLSEPVFTPQPIESTTIPSEPVFSEAAPFTDDNQPLPVNEPVASTSPVFPPLSDMPEILPPNLPEEPSIGQATPDIFSDIVPFESPTMFTEKVDSVEPEKIFPPIRIPAENPPQPFNAFEEMTIELPENKLAVESPDFWSTDANVNNIANQPLAMPEASPLHRKGK